MVVFDATILIALLHPDVAVPRHPETNEPIPAFRERIEHLVNSLEKTEEKIIVPTPALSEILVRAGAAAPEYLRRINLASVFRPASFDELCAVEVAEITKEALDSGDKRSGHDGTWAKIKYDRQIVAIAKVNNASILYSDDREIYKLGPKVGLTVIRIADLPLPPKEAQSSFTFEQKEEKNGKTNEN